MTPEELYRQENAKRGYPMRKLASGVHQKTKCPQCGSSQLSFGKKTKHCGQLARWMFCGECSHSWKSTTRTIATPERPYRLLRQVVGQW